MTDTDPLAAKLTEVRDRNEGRIEWARFTEYTVEHDVAEGDVRRLLAAVDEVLKLADDWDAEDSGGSALTEDRMWVRQDCGAKLRSAILAGLTGEGKASA